MAAPADQTQKPAGRRVVAETLAVAPEVLDLPLAEPWRRLAAIAVDVAIVALLDAFNTAGGASLVVPSEYLEVVVTLK